MNPRAPADLDWNLLRTFVAVAERGSLSAAARELGISQPTAGRHVAELETWSGGGLFARHPRGLALTPRGTALYELARAVRERVDAFTRRAAGDSGALEGTVRVSASQVVATFVLPGLLARVADRHPAIDLEVVADDSAANLLRRDADVAVRMFRPTQPELVARKVADAGLALYAHRRYVAAHGRPGSLDDLRRHRVVGFDRGDLHLRVLRRAGVSARREDFRVRSDSQVFQLQAVAAGLCLGAIQRAIARRLPDLVPVLPGVALPPLPVWLAAHADLRRAARVRAVYDALAEGLAAFYRAPPEGCA